MTGRSHLSCLHRPTDFTIGLGDCRAVGQYWRLQSSRSVLATAKQSISIGDCKAVDTIFSPEDGTPFSQLPPSLREGRSRLMGNRGYKGGLGMMTAGRAQASEHSYRMAST